MMPQIGFLFNLPVPNPMLARLFCLHPLTAALLMLPLSVTLAATDTTPVDNDAIDQQAEQTQQQASTWANAPSGYFLAKQITSLPANYQRHVPVSCQGVWITPIPNNDRANLSSGIANNTATTQGSAVHTDLSGLKLGATPTTDNNAPIVATADYAYYDPQQGASLSGDVQIAQANRLLQAQSVELDASQTIATANGQVRLASPGLVTQSDHVRYNLKTGAGDLSDVQFINEPTQAHGQAQTVTQQGDGVTILSHARYTTCEPQHPVWQINSEKLTLNNNTGRGIATNTTLYLQNIPIIYLPWFNFPIDDRRASGFLIPQGGYTNDGGLDLSIPYYFNLAPNYDLTATPRLLSRRHAMIEAEARYLSADYGSAVIGGGYLPQDPLYANKDRQRFNVQYDWQTQNNLNIQGKYSYVSDKDYFSDLGTDPLVTNKLNLERSLSARYRYQPWGLDAQFRVQTFQTVDPDTADINRPYSRLPQLLLHTEQGSATGWQTEFFHDSAYFKKQINDGSGTENSGVRLYHQAALRYHLQNSAGYLTPEISARHIWTQYDQDSQNSQGISQDDASNNTLVPQVTLAGGLVFDREGSYAQTLEPRFLYAYAPYQSQNQNPNFDTTTASQGYDQLFSPYRFLGHDRLDDNHFLSLGVTHRLYDRRGLERWNLSVGQRIYFDDRQVRLSNTDPIAQDDTSGPALRAMLQLNQKWRLDASGLWLPSGDNAQTLTQLQYDSRYGTLYQAGYIYRREVTQQNQKSLKQFTAAMIQPIYDQWRVFGYVQYDLDRDLSRDHLLGIDYDGCCFRLAVYGRQYYNDLDEPQTSDSRRVIMAELTLKGLAGLSGNLSSLLRQKIFGYTQVEQSWNSR